MSFATAALQRLPYPLAVAAAAARGRYLQRLRYGGNLEARVGAALLREGWSLEQWREFQAARLAVVLSAAQRAPWYARYGPRNASAPLAAWPVVRKELLRRHTAEFRSPRYGGGRPIVTHTSGSTGTPLRLWVSRAAVREWYGLFEARWRRWYGVSLQDRWAIIGGQLVVPIDRRKPPFWVWNPAMGQLYISAYHIAPWSAAPIVSAMARKGVRYLYGYASAMAELARLVREQSIPRPTLQVTISNAEPLLPRQRALIAQAFGCRVVTTYGMSEMVAGAAECEHGRLHLWPEAGVVEVVDEHDRPAPPGETGRLICTGLLNEAMPLIRYEVGDRGALAPPDEQCPCGRKLPILREVEGRLDDVVITPDGRRIGRLDTVFKADFPIRRAQIIQDALDHLIVNVEPALDYGPDSAAAIADAVRARVGGGIRIETQVVAAIDLTGNGKFRGVISHVAREMSAR